MCSSDLTIASNGRYVRDRIQHELVASGFNLSEKLYAVYYEGSSNYTCGDAAAPPYLLGNTAVEYLHGGPPDVDCSANIFASDKEHPGNLEFTMLHEIIHLLGVITSCSPHQVEEGHVSDSTTDLMYAGCSSWDPKVLDFRRDDYYEHHIPNCPDLANSRFLQ